METTDGHDDQQHPDVDAEELSIGKVLPRRQALAVTLHAGLSVALASPRGKSFSAPKITGRSTEQSVMVGATAVLSVMATGGNLSFQWFKDGFPLPGANGNSFSIRSAESRDSGQYHVTVSNPLGTVSTEPVALWVNSVVDIIAVPTTRVGRVVLDERLKRSDLMSCTNRATVVNGVPFSVEITLYAIAGKSASVLPGAIVELWHCDCIGAYSDQAPSKTQTENTRGQKWLRGYQITDADGFAIFHTIYPGWYVGRTVHFHLKVRSHDTVNHVCREFATDLFIDDSISMEAHSRIPYRAGRTVFNANDHVYSATHADGTLFGSDLMLNMSGGIREGFTGRFSLALSF